MTEVDDNDEELSCALELSIITLDDCASDELRCADEDDARSEELLLMVAVLETSACDDAWLLEEACEPLELEEVFSPPPGEFSVQPNISAIVQNVNCLAKDNMTPPLSTVEPQKETGAD